MRAAETNDRLASLLQHAVLKSTGQMELGGHLLKIFLQLICLFGSLIRVLKSHVAKCYVELSAFASGELWLAAFSETLSAAK